MTAKPRKASRTLKLANVLMGIGGFFALVPELVSDPVVMAFLNEFLSPTARRVLAVLTVVVGYLVRYLRMTTTQPIERRRNRR